MSVFLTFVASAWVDDQAASSDDDLSSLIPDTKSVNMSKQRTIFLSALGGRGKRGRAKKGTRGRGRKNTRTQLVEVATPITGAREDTDIPGGSDSEAVSTKGSEEQTENKSASNIEQKTADRLLRNESNKATGTKRKSARNTHHLPTLESVISMDVDVTDSPSIVSGNNTETDSITKEQDKPDKGQTVRGGRSSTRRGRGRGGGGSRKVKTETSPKQGTDGVTQSLAKDESVCPMSVADVMSGDLLEESPDLPVTATPKDEGASSGEKTPSDEYTSTQSASSDGTASVNSSKGGRGKRGRGRGKRTSTPRRGKTIKTEGINIMLLHVCNDTDSMYKYTHIVLGCVWRIKTRSDTVLSLTAIRKCFVKVQHVAMYSMSSSLSLSHDTNQTRSPCKIHVKSFAFLPRRRGIVFITFSPRHVNCIHFYFSPSCTFPSCSSYPHFFCS